MITAEELYHTLHRKPFQPLRVHIQDGRVFDILHERMAVVGVDYLDIGVPAPGVPLPICDYTEMIPLDWITRVETLNLAEPATT